MREERVVMSLDKSEHGVVITALNDKRNILLKNKRCTDVVDGVLLKVIDAPSKKVRVRDDEAR